MFGGDHWELELTTLLVAVGGMDGTQPAALFDRAEGTVLAALVAQLRRRPDGRVSCSRPNGRQSRSAASYLHLSP
jgi:hypothetical protein